MGKISIVGGENRADLVSASRDVIQHIYRAHEMTINATLSEVRQPADDNRAMMVLKAIGRATSASYLAFDAEFRVVFFSENFGARAMPRLKTMEDALVALEPLFEGLETLRSKVIETSITGVPQSFKIFIRNTRLKYIILSSPMWADDGEYLGVVLRFTLDGA